MSGPNKNLPLFIPLIQTNSFNVIQQTDPNLTIYTTTLAYQRVWWYTDTLGANQQYPFTITPNSTAVSYVPETQNVSSAPVPYAAPNGIIKQDISSRYYWVYTYKHWVDLVNQTFLTAMIRLYTSFRDFWNLPTNGLNIDLAVSPFPYTNFEDFLADHDAPFIKYDENTRLFSIYGDTRAFNVGGQLGQGQDPVTGLDKGAQLPLPAWVDPPAPSAPSPAFPSSQPFLRLFMNNNMFGLFTNFNNTYLGASNGSTISFPLGSVTITLPPNESNVPSSDYTTEILFRNQQYTNILNNNPLLQNVPTIPPPTYNLLFLIPTYKQNLYWISTQDYPSTGSLWSPVASIVFTSTLLPIKNEYSAAVIQLGNSTASSQNPSGNNAAFSPIITDTTCDLSIKKAEGWRDFILYEPTAEYKFSSLTASHEEIRNLDVQVFWKYRLTGELIPLTLYNCSDVSIKMLFKKVGH